MLRCADGLHAKISSPSGDWRLIQYWVKTTAKNVKINKFAKIPNNFSQNCIISQPFGEVSWWGVSHLGTRSRLHPVFRRCDGQPNELGKDGVKGWGGSFGRLSRSHHSNSLKLLLLLQFLPHPIISVSLHCARQSPSVLQAVTLKHICCN